MGQEQSILGDEVINQQIQKIKQETQQKKREIIDKALQHEHKKNRETLSRIDFEFSEQDFSKLVLLPHDVIQEFSKSFDHIEKKVAEYKKKLIKNVIHQAQQQGILKSSKKKLDELSPEAKQHVLKKIKEQDFQQKQKQKQLLRSDQDQSIL